MSSTLTHHRLQLPRDTDPQVVLAMIRNVRPGATWRKGAIEVGYGARLIPDRSPRGAGRWTLEVARIREDPQPADLDDTHGYGAAFPDGLPFRDERACLDLVWSLARRLDGAVVTDSGARLEPHPCVITDLAVVSPYALAPHSLYDLVRPIEPAIIPPSRAEVKAAFSGALAGYDLLIPIEPTDRHPEAEADLITIGVRRTHHVPALRKVQWVRGAVEYMIRFEPVDEGMHEVSRPDEQIAATWLSTYRRIGHIAGVIVEAIGGHIVDGEGFLVAPADLM